MNIDKNINSCVIHIPGGKLKIVSITGQQEKGATNDSDRLILSIHNSKHTFLDSTEK